MALSLEQLRAKAQLAPVPSPGQGLQLDPQGRLPVSLLRINGIVGSVSAAGAIVSGTGFTVAKGAAGIYTVTFTPTLSAVPIVVINAIGNTAIPAHPRLVTAAGFEADLYSAAFAGQDDPWNFIAINAQ